MTDENKPIKKVFSIRKDILIAEDNQKKEFKPDPELLKATEILLQKVKSGEINHFVVVTSGVLPDGFIESYSAWFGHTDVPEFTYCELENIKDDYRAFYIRPVSEDE